MDRTLTSRFEFKYLVPESQIALMRHHMRPFMRLDPYSERAEQNRYVVCSLYLDHPDLRLYQTTVDGLKNRFKLRMRTYADAPDAPVFLEIKRRVSDTILKTRVEVGQSAATAIAKDRLPPREDRDAEEASKFEAFCDAVRQTGAGPVIRVRYLREAYESQGSEPIRVTFDYQLSHAVTLGADLGHDGPNWHTTPINGVIVEVKFTDRFPIWLNKMSGLFEMHRIPIPKYILCVDEALRRGTLSSALMRSAPIRR